MGKLNAGVIVKTRFVDKQADRPGKSLKAFSSYIDYINRSEAIRNDYFSKYNLSSQYKGYNDYMGNPEKTSGLFTNANDTLNSEQKKALKDAFQKGYDNDSIMWQTVISFDNRFLTQLGIYDPETKSLNEQALRNATRLTMKETLQNENMANSAVWSAAIHFNTDNIHIHIAYTEPVSTRVKMDIGGQSRPRGYFSKKTMRNMKSKFVNSLLDSEFSLEQKIRDYLIGSKKKGWSLNDERLRDLWIQIYKQLPPDRRKWYYKMNAMEPIRPLLDKLSQEYIRTYHSEEYNQYLKMIMEKQAIYKTAYGRNSSYSNYAENKIKELHKRMGNVILSEMREYSKVDMLFNTGTKTADIERVNMSIGRLKNMLANAFNENARNKYEHEKLEEDIRFG